MQTFRNLQHKHFYSISCLIYSLLEVGDFPHWIVGKQGQITAFHDTSAKITVNINDNQSMLGLLKSRAS